MKGDYFDDNYYEFTYDYKTKMIELNYYFYLYDEISLLCKEDYF